LERAERWLIAELADDSVLGIEDEPNPMAKGTVTGDVEALSRVDVVITTDVSPAVREQLQLQGIEVLTGVTGTARMALLDYVIGRLGPDVSERPACHGDCGGVVG